MSKQVLIVEDEIFVALDLEEALEGAGYSVVGIAADRAEALRQAGAADVALVDLNLRDGPTGVALGMELAARGIQVLFLTANMSTIASGVAGAVGCLGKPCPPEAVCAAVEFATTRDQRHIPDALTLFG